MSARVVSLRELLIEDAARVALKADRPAVARLLRRADVSDEDVFAASADLKGRSIAAALAHVALGEFDAALGHHCDVTGLDRRTWLAETCAEQGVEVSL